MTEGKKKNKIDIIEEQTNRQAGRQAGGQACDQSDEHNICLLKTVCKRNCWENKKVKEETETIIHMQIHIANDWAKAYIRAATAVATVINIEIKSQRLQFIIA